ncbi:MAG TPA: VanW family protein [Candidatus Limnocylindrales bacterium]
MTTTTPDSIALAPGLRRPSKRVRFVVAFLVGLIAAMALGAGALYAYDQQYAGRVLPGVRVGTVDLSGLDPATAAEQLRSAYASLGEGELVLTSPAGAAVIPYADIERGPDIDAMLAEAMAAGRADGPVERAISNARTALRGIVLEPRVTFDADALAGRIERHASSLATDPVEASVTLTSDGAYEVKPGADGRVADPKAAIAAAVESLGALDAPARIELELPVAAVEPSVTTAEATDARVDAERLTQTIELPVGDKTHEISTETLRSWVTFGPVAGRSYGPTIETSGLAAIVKKLAKKVDMAAVSASFKTSGGRITGVTASHEGRKLDVKATTKQLLAVFAARAGGQAATVVEPAVKTTAPALTTAEAKAALPKMRRISRWTTYFPIGEKNGFGANIWIPARLIDGYVVPPGGTFDFWKAVGPVTRAKGFRSGGAIINGRTEPQGALAGGICSCSTTLFNAAARAGYDMGARRNHYYYIDRYPVGLDATVFISASGSKQTMSFTNDTDYPLLIRGRGWRNGAAGYVRFDIYSVPTGRKVSFKTGPKRNYRNASDTVQYTKSLKKGQSQRVEYPVDGFQVSVTRTVRDRKGKVVHRDTWFSNYARITGITLVGRG